MDAAPDELEQEQERLLARLAEISVQQQRRRGVFQSTPHMTELEEVSHALGQRLSGLSLARAAAEVAAEAPIVANCPGCGRSCRLKIKKRSVQGLDVPVDLLEPVGHCPACRRDFFPSAGSVGA